MQSVNRSPIALFFCHIRKRSRIFSVLPVPLRGFNHRFKFFSSVSIIFRNHLFPLFLIVHHNISFALLQHKVICKLLLSVVCGRPFSFILSVSRPSCSLGLRTSFSELLPVFHLLYSIRCAADTSIQDTHVLRLGVVADF